MRENSKANPSTFTNFAQNGQKLYSLHTYFMFLKYGFGRAFQDACIEIRSGAMSRDQAINLVKLYDHLFPKIYIKDYLRYYELDKKIFNRVTGNKNLDTIN